MKDLFGILFIVFMLVVYYITRVMYAVLPWEKVVSFKTWIKNSTIVNKDVFLVLTATVAVGISELLDVGIIKTLLVVSMVAFMLFIILSIVGIRRSKKSAEDCEDI